MPVANQSDSQGDKEIDQRKHPEFLSSGPATEDSEFFQHFQIPIHDDSSFIIVSFLGNSEPADALSF